jgi:hypothetical protein
MIDHGNLTNRLDMYGSLMGPRHAERPLCPGSYCAGNVNLTMLLNHEQWVGGESIDRRRGTASLANPVFLAPDLNYDISQGIFG